MLLNFLDSAAPSNSEDLPAEAAASTPPLPLLYPTPVPPDIARPSKPGTLPHTRCTIVQQVRCVPSLQKDPRDPKGLHNFVWRVHENETVISRFFLFFFNARRIMRVSGVSYQRRRTRG